MGSIRRLDDVLVSKLAAGEVVERPASCVKELLDNALDAGSTKIVVSIDGGGLAKIQVDDDGAGIAQEDLPLALERHATSKISSFEDLLSVGTMGFRGEALASCAAVAHVSIASSRSDDGIGWKIDCSEGRQTVPEPMAKRRGTSVAVRDLFHFVPARRKFLKSEATEFRYCKVAVLRAALSRPGVAFALSRDGKAVVDLSAASPSARWMSVASVDATAVVPVSGCSAECSVSGFIARFRGSDPLAQTVFVNDRFVQDKIFVHACREAARSVPAFGPERDLAFFLRLTIPFRDVDCNAHPEKTTVRFKNPQQIHQLVFSAVRDAVKAMPSVSASDGREGARPDAADRGLAPSRPSVGNSAGFDENSLFESDPQRRPPEGGGAKRFKKVGFLSDGSFLVESFGSMFCVPPDRFVALLAGARLLADMASEGGGEKLLFPVHPDFRVDAPRLQTLRLYSAQLATMGWEFSDSGDIRSVPLGFASADLSFALSAMADELRGKGARAGILCSVMIASMPPVPPDGSGAQSVAAVDEEVLSQLHFRSFARREWTI